MSLDGINGAGGTVDIRGVAAAVRAGNVGAAQAAAPRFVPPDPFQVARRSGSQRSRAGDQPSDDDRSPEALDHRRGGGDRQAGRELSAFIAQSIAQDGEAGNRDPEGARVLSSIQLAGASAYARSAAAGQDRTTVEIIPPPLSSGHSLDLAV